MILDQEPNIDKEKNIDFLIRNGFVYSVTTGGYEHPKLRLIASQEQILFMKPATFQMKFGEFIHNRIKEMQDP